MAKAVVLANGRRWSTRKDALDHFKNMLGRYADGARITGPDENDLRGLLTLYDGVLSPGMPTKAGTGVAYFTRERNVGDGWATSGFHVHRTDGSSEDFSFYHAVRTAPSK